MKRIFVSSTFKDMNYERDTIQEIVLPELNAIARGYGESISVCDLRWGVNTAELETDAGSRKVLSVCLDEIDNCRPYMLVLLGERYGWIPSEALISDTIENRRNLTLDELEKSVTALEIEYGALPDTSHTLFYFRELTGDAPAEYRKEDAHHQKKLAELKQRILRATGGQVKTYRVSWDKETNSLTGMDTFAQTVITDIRTMLEEEWQSLAKLTPNEKDLRGQWEYARFKSRQFSARDPLIREYQQILAEENLLAIQGAAGSGKSTLMSRLAVTLQEAGNHVLPIFCGSSSLCCSTLDIIKYTVDHLESRLSLPHFAHKAAAQVKKPDGKAPSIKDWQDRLAEVIRIHARRNTQPVYILIDAVDQLTADEDRALLRFIPPRLCNRVKLVFSCLDDFSLPRSLMCKTVAPLAESDRQQIIQGLLDSLGRSLDRPVIAAMIDKPGSDNPLYLSLLVHRLTMMDKEDFAQINAMGGGMDQITAHQVGIIAACDDHLNGLCVDILQEASRKIGGDMVLRAAEFLAISRYGLRDLDLANLFQQQLQAHWNSLDFSRFLHYMSSFFFLRSDGRYDFIHKSFREGLAHVLHPEQLHAQLLGHFCSLPLGDPIAVQEIPYHCILSDARQTMFEYIERYAFTPPIPELAAKTMANLAQKDNGTWLLEWIDTAETFDAGHGFLCFVCSELDNAFLSTQYNLLLKKQLFKKLIVFSKARAERLKSPQAWDDLAFLYTTYGRTLTALGSASDYQLARICHESAMKIRQSLFDHSSSEQTRQELAMSYLAVASVYRDYDSQEDHKNCLALCQKAIDLLSLDVPSTENRIRLAAAYTQMARVYIMLDGAENLSAALQCFERCRQDLEQLYAEQPTDEVLSFLSNYYFFYGSTRFLHEMGDADGKTMSVMERAIDLLEQLSARDDTIAGKETLADAYHMFSSYLCILQGKENLLRAQCYAEKSLAVQQELVHTLQSAARKHELVKAYESLASIIINAADPDKQNIALMHLESALALEQEVAQQQQTPDHQKKLADLLYLLSQQYAGQEKPEQLTTAVRCSEECYKILETLQQQSASIQRAHDLALGYQNAGNIYLALETKDANKEALKLFRAAHPLCLQFQEEDPSDTASLGLAISYSCLGNALIRDSSPAAQKESLECFKKALALYEQLDQQNHTYYIECDLMETMYQVAAHRLTTGAEETKYIRRILSLAKKLYRQSGSASHKFYVDTCRRALWKIFFWWLSRIALLLGIAAVFGLLIWWIF